MLLKVLIAGGGTGGHLFPGIALAEELTTRHPENDVLFVGTARGLEATVVPRVGFKLELIDVAGIKGKGLSGLVRGLFKVPGALFAAGKILRRYKPAVVVGVGGYASGPVVMAAWLMGIPTAVLEQNALPGLTNKLLGKIAKRSFVSFEEARRFFPAKRTSNVGNPIRRALLENFLRPEPRSAERARLLVFGGSLGAHAINVATVEALKHLGPGQALEVVHQTGEKDLEETRAAYAAAGVPATVVPFIEDMSAAYAAASVIVCRAGATTLAELTVCKKAAILIPFPQAADDHQTVNAAALVAKGAAAMIPQAELTGERLAAEIRQLVEDPARRHKMERAAGLLGRPEAAKEIADVLVELVFGEGQG